MRLYDAVADLLAAAAADSPLLVVLDDLHWADASSLRLLAHVASAEPAGAAAAGGLLHGERAGRVAGAPGDPATRSRATRAPSGWSSPGSAPEAVRALLPSDSAVPESILSAVHSRTARQPVLRRRAGAADVDRRPARHRHRDARARARARGRPPARRAARRRRSARVLEVGAVAGRFTIADLVRAAGVSRAAAAAARSTAGRRPGSSPPRASSRASSPSPTGSSATPCATRCPSSGAERCTRRSPPR